MTYKKPYEQYLSSKKWKLLRSKARERAGYKCEFCSGKPDHVHHIKYPKRHEKDHIDNLVVVCEACHSKLHGIREDQELLIGLFLMIVEGVSKENSDIFLKTSLSPDFSIKDYEFIKEDKHLSEALVDVISVDEFEKKFGIKNKEAVVNLLDGEIILLPRSILSDHKNPWLSIDIPFNGSLVKKWTSGELLNPFGDSFKDQIIKEVEGQVDDLMNHTRKKELFMEDFLKARNEVYGDSSPLQDLVPAICYLPFRYTQGGGRHGI